MDEAAEPEEDEEEEDEEDEEEVIYLIHRLSFFKNFPLKFNFLKL